LILQFLDRNDVLLNLKLYRQKPFNKIDVIGVPSTDKITSKIDSILVSCESSNGVDNLRNEIKRRLDDK